MTEKKQCAIAERIGFWEMTEIRRQRDAWQKQATRDFASERTMEGLLAYEQHDHVHAFNTQAAAMTGMIEQWDEVRVFRRFSVLRCSESG